MTWFAISNGRRAIRHPDALAASADSLIATGSLVIEATFAADPGQPQTLIRLDRTQDWHRSFCVTLRASGEVFIEHRQNHETTCALLRFPKPDRDAVLRLTCSWNAPARQGLLTVENLDTGQTDQAGFDDPQPWPLDDIRALIGAEPGCAIDPGISLIAFSDRVEPVGLAPGLVADTVVRTAAGPRLVQDLARGDLVLTADHGMQPVRWVVSRELPALGRFAPIRLRAPFFGLERDLCLAPDHRILIEGADAEYLFGADAVLVEARHLAGMAATASLRSAETVRYVHVVLDSHDCLAVSGAWAESLFLGDLADHPVDLANSILADIPADLLPRHTRIANPLLKSYEAVVLVSAMCA